MRCGVAGVTELKTNWGGRMFIVARTAGQLASLCVAVLELQDARFETESYVRICKYLVLIPYGMQCMDIVDAGLR